MFRCVLPPFPYGSGSDMKDPQDAHEPISIIGQLTLLECKMDIQPLMFATSYSLPQVDGNNKRAIHGALATILKGNHTTS